MEQEKQPRGNSSQPGNSSKSSKPAAATKNGSIQSNAPSGSFNYFFNYSRSHAQSEYSTSETHTLSSDSSDFPPFSTSSSSNYYSNRKHSRSAPDYPSLTPQNASRGSDYSRSHAQPEKDPNRPFSNWTRKEIEKVAPMAFHGNQEDETDAAHICSLELVQGVAQGFPASITNNYDENVETYKYLQGRAENLRLKTQRGNRKTDRVNDHAILRALKDKRPFNRSNELGRAVAIIHSTFPPPGQEEPQLLPIIACFVDVIGKHPVKKGSEPYPTVYDLAGRVPSRYVDEACELIQNGSLLLKHSGSIDERSSAIKNREVLLTNSGEIDERCTAFKDGRVFKPVGNNEDRRGGSEKHHH